MTCGRCWKGITEKVQEIGHFRLVRDPGHWGSSNPSTLVLGISKGNTQSNAFGRERFDTVAFKGIRHRMLEVLQSVGLLEGETVRHFESRFTADENEYAFASVVRCSLTGMDRKKGTHTADSPNVIPAFKSGSLGNRVASNCVDQHIVQLPQSTKRVVLLGNSDAYVKALRSLIGQSRGDLQAINEIAYRAGNVLFVHVTHPSKGNGFFGAYVRGEGVSGRKRDLAREAILSEA